MAIVTVGNGVAVVRVGAVLLATALTVTVSSADRINDTTRKRSERDQRNRKVLHLVS
jgi:hypothetical protein